MDNRRRMKKVHWPAVDIPDSVFALFVENQLVRHSQFKVTIDSRDCFLTTLQESRIFAKFWDHVRRRYSHKGEYFANLMDNAKPFEPVWIKKEYYWYLFGKGFKKMDDDRKEKLEARFYSIRPKAYQAALKGEAIRLNCDVAEVRPLSPVLALELNANEESKLIDLPDSVLIKIMNNLDTLDVFRMTLVCKRWKNLVYDNPRELRRFEHARTTHVITFNDWMDPAKTQSCRMFARQYYQFSLGLVRWYCGISSNLETLILCHPVPYSNVATLLQSCPNLKNIQLGDNSAHHDSVPGELLPKVQLPNLEVYLASENDIDQQSRQMRLDILSNVKHLQVLKSSIQNEDIEHLAFVCPVINVFQHLTALDLTRFTNNTLKVLAAIPNLQLKYLRLGDLSNELHLNGQEYEIATAKYRDAFHKLLPKLRRLERLKTWFVPGVTNETIQLLTDLDLNLKYASLAHSLVSLRQVSSLITIEIPADPLDPTLLIEFRDRLLLRNPDLDLSELHFIVRKPESRDQLLAADIGFTFTNV